MPVLKLPDAVVIAFPTGLSDCCFNYAVRELERILSKFGVRTQREEISSGHHFWLRITKLNNTASQPLPQTAGLTTDSYVLQITPDAAQITASQAKGILNGVYDFAGRTGIAFVLPTDAGELLPPSGKPLPLSTGEWRMIPRFPYRGVFAQLECAKDYPPEEWLRFYAKLRFNAVSHRYASLSLARELGIRLEIGGHGLSHLLPRERFENEPDLFRMFQPDDFGGKRRNDSNFCPTNPRAKKIVRENFEKKIQEAAGAHAIHAWADDLPAGGWCLCPSCRALPPTDQAMLAMRHLAGTVSNSGMPVRIPVLAYHDTMFPGQQIAAPKESFLLYAPRERCYGHAIDDSTCPRNRYYFQALQEWMQKFAGIDDSHTFEYYFDQILFRGMYPFLPQIILDDMHAYEQAGIECHLSLQVAGPEIAPEFNMLVFALGLWDRELTPTGASTTIAKMLCPEDNDAAEAWAKYLQRRGEIFIDAMRTCGHNLDIYLDYRWLPETTLPFGREIADTYARCATQLHTTTRALEAHSTAGWSAAQKELVAKEIRRADFEAAELEVMAYQQHSMNELAGYHNGGGRPALTKAIAYMRKAIDGFQRARPLALAAGIYEDAWYCKNINTWITRELAQKIAQYETAET